MTDEQKKDPSVHLKDLNAVIDEQLIVLSCTEPIQIGTSTYGEWYLWSGSVTNTTVYHGKGKAEKKEEAYTGDVVFFPTTSLNKKLIEICKGKKGATVSIKKEVKKGTKSDYLQYEVTLIKEGTEADTQSFSPTELKFLKDLKGLISDGIPVPEESAIKLGAEAEYELDATRVKELYVLMIKK